MSDKTHNPNFSFSRLIANYASENRHLMYIGVHRGSIFLGPWRLFIENAMWLMGFGIINYLVWVSGKWYNIRDEINQFKIFTCFGRGGNAYAAGGFRAHSLVL